MDMSTSNVANVVGAWTTAPQPPAMTVEERDALLSKWHQAVKVLEAAKATELELRNAAVKALFDGTKSGTQSIDLGNGYKVKAVVKFNYSLDKEKIDGALAKMEAMGDEGKLLASRLVKWSPSLSTTEYKELPAKYVGIIDDVLTISPGTPSLELVEPKAKK